MTKEIICTVCPTGCTIHVEGENGTITKIEGFSCPRGKLYAENEFISPVRILTSTAKVKNAKSPLVAVRSRTPFDCMDEIRKLDLTAPVKRGDVLIKDVCGTGVDIIATGEVL